MQFIISCLCCFHATIAELRSCDRDLLACEALELTIWTFKGKVCWPLIQVEYTLSTSTSHRYRPTWAHNLLLRCWRSQTTSISDKQGLAKWKVGKDVSSQCKLTWNWDASIYRRKARMSQNEEAIVVYTLPSGFALRSPWSSFLKNSYKKTKMSLPAVA